jgi:hypothetical protein
MASIVSADIVIKAKPLLMKVKFQSTSSFSPYPWYTTHENRETLVCRFLGRAVKETSDDVQVFCSEKDSPKGSGKGYHFHNSQGKRIPVLDLNRFTI